MQMLTLQKLNLAAHKTADFASTPEFADKFAQQLIATFRYLFCFVISDASIPTSSGIFASTFSDSDTTNSLQIISQWLLLQIFVYRPDTLQFKPGSRSAFLVSSIFSPSNFNSALFNHSKGFGCTTN